MDLTKLVSVLYDECMVVYIAACVAVPGLLKLHYFLVYLIR